MLLETCELAAEQLEISPKDLVVILNDKDEISMRLFIRMYKLLFNFMPKNKPNRIGWFHAKNKHLNNKSPIETCMLVDGIQLVIDYLVIFTMGDFS